MDKRKKRVLVAMMMHGSIGQERLAGIFRYLSENQRWDIDIIRDVAEFTPSSVKQAIDKGLDGLIAGISTAHDTLAWLSLQRIPTVVLNPAAEVERGSPDFRKRENAGVVYNDAVAIGRAAAEELLSQGGFRSFAYVGYPINHGWSIIRGRAFAETLRKAGFKTAMFDRAHFGDRMAERNCFARWIQRLEKPCGLLAVGDGPGCSTIETCHELGIRVPEDIAAIGVNNDTILCDNISPGLTSVHPDFELSGYESARMLDDLMEGRPISPRAVAIGVKEIVRRGSSRPVSPGGRLVEKAIAFIDTHARQAIDVDDVVRHLRVSRRLVEMRFRDLLGDTIGNTIMNRRLDEVKRQLLSSPHETIERISFLCGFENPISLKNCFRRRMGLSMRDYRRQQLAGVTKGT